MTKTMIQIETETRDKIKSLGSMGDTYDSVLQRLYKQAVEVIMAKTLLDTTDTIEIEKILRRRNLI